MATLKMADVLRMALRTEKENHDEYAKHAREMTNPAVRKMFAYLADEEKKHIKLIQDKMVEHKVSE